MPTYVYRFTDTGETIEVQQAFTDDALTEAVHPTTGATMQVKKVFLPVGVTFRGGGFYKNDSRGPGAKNKSGGDSSGDKSTGDKSGEKSTSDSSSSDKSSSTTPTNSESAKPAKAPAPATTSSTSKD
ncbi:MAG: FmdB family transcriptional regulator [Ilumatobacteraceae bacterium]